MFECSFGTTFPNLKVAKNQLLNLLLFLEVFIFWRVNSTVNWTFFGTEGKNGNCDSNANKLDISGYELHPEYRHLTPRIQSFISEYAQSIRIIDVFVSEVISPREMTFQHWRPPRNKQMLTDWRHPPGTSHLPKWNYPPLVRNKYVQV